MKVAILDEDGKIIGSVYRRHLSNIRETLTDILHNLTWRFGDLSGTAAVTGSAGIALADMLGAPFFQEVLATTRAVREVYPDADAVIELGGEDAKVMYLSGTPEQRMNATCAGGTGGFIDTIAFMLGVRTSEMSRLAGGASRTYPIASRCAVFAQTDIRPLLNAGAKKSDIAASALEAVVRQTITGLACGRPVGLMNCFETYEYIPLWHTLFSSLGFSVVVPNDARGEAFEREALATVPAESACFPAKMAHMRLFDLIEAGAQTIFMPVLERGGRCAVSCEYACALKGTVPAVARGEVAFSSPRLSSFKASRIIASDDDRAALLSALAAMRPDDSPLTEGEFEQALQAGVAAQEKFFQDVERANAAVMDWLAEDSRRHAIVVAGRPYHTDPRLMRGVDVMLAKLGFALLCPTSLEAWAKRIPHDPNCPPWKPGKHLARLARFAAANPQVDLVCLQSFGCGYDALSLEDARDILDAAGKPFTALKVDDLSDKAHIGIRLRTLAEGIETASRRRGVAGVSERRSGEGAPDATRDGKDSSLRGDFERTLGANSVGEGRPARSEGAGACETRACDGQMSITDFMGSGISTEDATVALREIPSDVCFTAAALMARALRVMDENPQVKEMHIPLVCNRCLLDGLGHTLWRLRGRCPEVAWEEEWPDVPDARKPERGTSPNREHVRVGLVGNPLLCFDPFMNDSIVQLLESLGCEVAMPEASRLFVEDVRYLDQLDEFAREGVDCVVYLQSFGCMKAHVHARGFAREYARRYPNMPITVIDYDPESSALNRENRIRLAVEAAQQAKKGR